MNVSPVTGLPEIREGDDLAALITERTELEDGDVLVVAQKAVSKAEGRVVRLDELEPSERALELAGDEDPRQTEAILREAVEIIRIRPPLLIVETRHGFICASAGVDASNAPEPGMLVLLPLDPDASAARIRDRVARADRRARRRDRQRLVRPPVAHGDDGRRDRRCRPPRARRPPRDARHGSATSSARRRSQSRTSSPVRPSS